MTASNRGFSLRTLAVAACLVAGAGSASADVIYHSNVNQFNAALTGAVSVEDFGDSTLVPGLSISNSGSIAGGVFNDQVNGAPDALFSFATAINGFGGNFDLRPGGQGAGIRLTITLLAGGTELLSREIENMQGQFFGFTSDLAFNAVQFSLGTGGGVESYTLDNLRFGANAAPNAVPEPMSFALVGLGLLGLAGTARRARSGAKA